MKSNSVDEQGIVQNVRLSGFRSELGLGRGQVGTGDNQHCLENIDACPGVVSAVCLLHSKGF